MALKLKNLFARGPETIQAEKVLVKELPLEEIAFTVGFILIAGFWLVFSGDVVDWIMGVKINSPTVQTLRGINFVTTTSLVLYLVLRRTLRRRRQAEEALRLSQQRFESVALATTDAIWDLNLETKVVWWSDSMHKLFGYKADEVSSNFEWWHQRVHPEDRERVSGAIRQAVDSGGRQWSGEYRFRRQDGSYAVVLDRGYIIHDAAKKPVRLVGGLSDISERHLAERSLASSRQQLRALTARLQTGREEERAAVAREIHDDLGQVLTAMKLNLDWLEREMGNEKEQATFNRWIERVVETEEMTENAIDSVQRIATNLRPVLLDNLGLAEALQEESTRFQERSGITCKLELPEQTPKLPPEASIALFRVFQEALTNVARHAQAKEVRISLQSQGQMVVLQVDDDGVGIAPELTTDPRSLGMVGMAERAMALGGQVSVGPHLPRGTRVTFQLPLKEAHPVPQGQI